MQQIEQQVVDGLRTLSLEKQQEVLDFIEFLQVKANASSPSTRTWEPGTSALVAAGNIVGSVEGPEDLSTNPKYMEGFGES